MIGSTVIKSYTSLCQAWWFTRYRQVDLYEFMASQNYTILRPCSKTRNKEQLPLKTPTTACCKKGLLHDLHARIQLFLSIPTTVTGYLIPLTPEFL